MKGYTQTIQENQIGQLTSISKQISILLITVQSNTDVIGLKYLHAYLRKNNISSHILILPDYNETMNSAVEKFFNETKPQLVGLSVLSTEFPEIEKLSIFLKSKHKFISFMGGYHATIDPQQCSKYADFVIRGEAEDVLLEVCNTLKAGGDISKIPNLAYMQNNFFVQNPMREPETNLDKYPFHENLPPETYVFDHGEIKIMNNALFKKYSRYNGRFYSLTTTRGCNLRCGFCIHSFLTKLRKEENMKGPLIRTRSVDNCMEELRLMKRQYPDTVYINIQDDNFLDHNIEWLKEFRDKVKKEINIPLCARAIPIFLTEEKAKVLTDAGLTWVFMGLQTGSQRIQREIYQRMISNEQFLKATRIINDLKLVPFYDVILDSPFENEEDVLETIKVLTQIPKPYQLQLFSLAFYPGTRIYDIAKEKNIDVDDPYRKYYHKFNTSSFLNKVIRLIPLLPPSITNYLVNNRNKKVTKNVSLPLIYYLSIMIIEPVVWMRLIKLSFGGSMSKTLNMLKSFVKTGIKNRILRKV